MMDTIDHTAGHDSGNDASLLEGLFQLVLTGHTHGWEFEQLDAEVYQRLHEAYGVAHCHRSRGNGPGAGAPGPVSKALRAAYLGGEAD